MKTHLTILQNENSPSEMSGLVPCRRPVSVLPIGHSASRRAILSRRSLAEAEAKRRRVSFYPSAFPMSKPVSALLMQLFWAAALVMPVIGTPTAVVLTTLHSFTGTNDGASPAAELVQGGDGNFYGTTEGGGTNNLGTVFKISTIGSLISLYSFNGNDGENPTAGLVQGSDGYFYGTTDGLNLELIPNTVETASGTVFKFGTNEALTNLYSFFGSAFINGEGECPVAELVQGSDGYFYGTAEEDGTNGVGTVFKFSTNEALTTLHSFNGTDGAFPVAGLVQGSDGYFYGTTEFTGYQRGGGNSGFPGTYGTGYGTVFKISTNGVLTTLYAFGTVTNESGDALDGANPAAALVQGSDGYFYGTTSEGGRFGDTAFFNNGTVFKISTNGALPTLYAFDSVTNEAGIALDGAYPLAGLVQGSDGDFYGTTYLGGTNNLGTVFKISVNGALTSLYSFTGGNDGGEPCAGLVLGSDGSFYGTTSAGTNDQGTVFRLTLVPEFQAVTLTKTTLNLTWSTEAGARYQLQHSPDLNSSNWTNLGSPITATGATLSTTDSFTNAPQRFYRLVLAP